MKEENLIYLAIPYSWNPTKSFELANEIAAKLMMEGHIVFSPISHSHSIANYMDESFRKDYHFWMSKDIPLLSRCDEVWFVVYGKTGLDLLNESKGCVREYNEAEKLGKPIKYYSYEKGSVYQVS